MDEALAVDASAPPEPATRSTGRPTSSPPTAAWCTCARSCRATPTRSSPCTAGCRARPATCATSARQPTSPTRDLERFTDVDHDARVALVAVLGGEIIAAGRYEARRPGRHRDRRPGGGRVPGGGRPPGPRARLDPARAPRRGRPRSGASAGSTPRCWARTARWSGCSSTPATRSAASTTPASSHLVFDIEPTETLDGGPRRPASSAPRPERAQRAAPALGRGDRRLHRPRPRSATRCW